MENIRTWLSNLQLGGIMDTIIVVAAALICITFHEVSHGFVAYRLGDPTAKNAGRLTLNPIRHIDIWGLIMMAVFKFGWAKPVPVDMRYFKKPKSGMAITALAGPVSNVVLAFAALLIRAVCYAFFDGQALLSGIISFLEYVAILSAGLAIFNIIPIPPLDGSKVLFSLLPEKAYYKILRYERYGMLLLMLVLFSGILDTPLYVLRTGLLDGLSKIAWFPYEIITNIRG